MANQKPHSPRRNLWLLPLILAAVLLTILLTLGIPAVRNALDPYGGKILEGVSVSGVSLGGMTRQEAEKQLEEAFTDKAMTLTLPGKTLSLTAQETGLKLDTRAIAKAAYNIGRKDDAALPLSAAPYLTFNADTCRAALERAAKELAGDFTPSTFFLEGELPDLTEGQFQPDTPLPGLVVQTGIPAYSLDVEAAWEQLLQSLSQGEFEIDLTASAAAIEPDALDADDILEAVSIAPVDAAMDKDTFQLIPGSYGVSFDAGQLAKQLKNAAPGSRIQVELYAEAPQVLGQEAYFQDVLGFCQTPHGDNKQRCTNLQLACQALNGVVLQPGETLSYNATLGQRTAEAGYQEAPAYSGTQLVNTLGGGICQVSSTLYLCSLYAELETVERVCHGYPSSYMPVGLDATVSWGSPDLKIKNNSQLPVKLIAEDQEGFVRVWIMGTETRDYYVRMGYSGSTDRYAKSFVCKYDRLTHELISREDHLFSAYLTEDVSAKGEIGSEEAYVGGVVKEMPPCVPTPQTLEASMNYQLPNTRG